jgi:hypothetical protein
LSKGCDILKVQQETSIEGIGGSLYMSYEEPEECPICRFAIKPKYLTSRLYQLSDERSRGFAVLYQCTHCFESFMLKCKASNVMGSTNYFSTGFLEIAPIKCFEENFNQHIKDVSSDFIRIYNQSLAAESFGLDDIAGIGYRKALEFLIKDYLITDDPSHEEIIKEMALGKCIQDKINNPQLQTVAQRATWLGNDHTHYVQKYDDKDIDDLKRLIRLSVLWISLILETKESEAIEKK